jgi:hypothetical protein
MNDQAPGPLVVCPGVRLPDGRREVPIELWRGGGFRVHQQSGKRRNGPHQMGESPLNRLVSRGQRPGYCKRSYVKFIWNGLRGLGYSGGPGKGYLDVDQSSFGHPRKTMAKRPNRSPRRRGILRACEPPGVLTRADSDGALGGTMALTAREPDGEPTPGGTDSVGARLPLGTEGPCATGSRRVSPRGRPNGPNPAGTETPACRVGPRSRPQGGWGGAWFIPQSINHIKAVASADGWYLVLLLPGRPGILDNHSRARQHPTRSSVDLEHKTSQKGEPLGGRVSVPG